MWTSTDLCEYSLVEQVQHEILEEPVFVHNFEIEDYHTYYVGGQSVFVYNKCSQRVAMREAKRSVNIPLSKSLTLFKQLK